MLLFDQQACLHHHPYIPAVCAALPIWYSRSPRTVQDWMAPHYIVHYLHETLRNDRCRHCTIPTDERCYFNYLWDNLSLRVIEVATIERKFGLREDYVRDIRVMLSLQGGPYRILERRPMFKSLRLIGWKQALSIYHQITHRVSRALSSHQRNHTRTRTAASHPSPSLLWIEDR